MIWDILRPVFRAGDTYAVDPGITRDDALTYWTQAECFVAEADSEALGTYYLKPNQPGGRGACLQLRLHHRTLGTRAGRGWRHADPLTC